MTYVWDHLHLRSPNPEAAAEFYVAHLGASITARVQNGAALRVILDLGGRAVFIEQVPPTTPAPPPAPFLGIEHLGLRVPNLDAAVADLKAKGVTFTMEPTSPRPGVKICFIEGPDRVRIELLERPDH